MPRGAVKADYGTDGQVTADYARALSFLAPKSRRAVSIMATTVGTVAGEAVRRLANLARRSLADRGIPLAPWWRLRLALRPVAPPATPPTPGGADIAGRGTLEDSSSTHSLKHHQSTASVDQAHGVAGGPKRPKGRKPKGGKSVTSSGPRRLAECHPEVQERVKALLAIKRRRKGS